MVKPDFNVEYHKSLVNVKRVLELYRERNVKSASEERERCVVICSTPSNEQTHLPHLICNMGAWIGVCMCMLCTTCDCDKI